MELHPFSADGLKFGQEFLRRLEAEEALSIFRRGQRHAPFAVGEDGRLRALIAVLAVVAVRLLSAKLLARSRPESGWNNGKF